MSMVSIWCLQNNIKINQVDDILSLHNNYHFIAGFISKPNTVLVDIGTGYFVEKDINAARAFLKKRVDMIQGNASKVNDLIKRKEQMLQDTQVAFQQKMQQAQAMNQNVTAVAAGGQ